MRDYISFTVNGKLHRLRGAQAFQPLSDTLRYDLGLTGTKVVCAEGDCGACTVMYARILESKKLHYRSLNSCIGTSILLDGCHIITVEGLREDGELCEVQNSMLRNFGSQCGFCTPGFVMSITNMYEHKTQVSEQNVKNYLTGNLCRCTGYRPILQAALDVDLKKHRTLGERFPFKELSRELEDETQGSILIRDGEREFFAPSNLSEAAEYKGQHKMVRIFSGATDLGVQVNKGKNPGTNLMSLHLVKELYELKCEEGRVQVGARVTLDRLQTAMEEWIPEFGRFLNIFASPQIKSAATLVGNLANGSPIADTIPFLLTMDAEKELVSPRGSRQVKVVRFFKGYKDMDLAEDEIISTIRFDLPKEKSNKLALYKVSQRRDLDISCVNSSFFFKMEKNKIREARLAFGGVGPTPMRLPKVEESLNGQVLSSQVLSLARQRIAESIAPLSDVRGSSEFRKLMCQRLFDRFAEEHLSS